MKRLLSVLLAMVMLASCTSAFAEGLIQLDYAEWGATLPIVPEGEADVTLKVAVPQRAQDVDWNKNWFWNWAKDAMNINFEVEQIPESGAGERKNLIFASNDLPDILWGVQLSQSDIVRYGQSEMQLLPINEYMTEELMPNLVEWSKQVSLETCMTPDGNIYAAPYIDYTAFNTGNGWSIFVDKEWMDKLGYTMPTTVEELTDLLRAYKADNPDIIPMGGSVNSAAYLMPHLMNAYGLGVLSGDNYGLNPAFLKCEELVVPCATEEYKYYLTTLKTWYDEGLISPDFFTMDDMTNMAQAAEGKYAALAFPFSSVWPNDFEAVKKYWAVPTLLSATNDVYSAPMNAKVRPGALVISADTAYPEVAVKFLDFLYSSLGMIYSWDGPMAGTTDTLGMVEGWYVDETGAVHYTDVEKGLVASITEIVAPCNGARLNNACEVGYDRNVYGRVALQQHMAGQEPQPSTMSADIITQFPKYTAYVAENTIHTAEDYYLAAYAFLDEETAMLVSDLKSVIGSYVQSETAKFVTGARSLDEYDDYLNELKAMGVDEYLQYYREVSGR